MSASWQPADKLASWPPPSIPEGSRNVGLSVEDHAGCMEIT
jgi:hypothetical protein